MSVENSWTSYGSRHGTHSYSNLSVSRTAVPRTSPLPLSSKLLPGLLLRVPWVSSSESKTSTARPPLQCPYLLWHPKFVQVSLSTSSLESLRCRNEGHG